MNREATQGLCADTRIHEGTERVVGERKSLGNYISGYGRVSMSVRLTDMTKMLFNPGEAYLGQTPVLHKYIFCIKIHRFLRTSANLKRTRPSSLIQDAP